VTPITALVSRAILPRRFVHGVVRCCRCCRFPGAESWLLSLLLSSGGSSGDIDLISLCRPGFGRGSSTNVGDTMPEFGQAPCPETFPFLLSVYSNGRCYVRQVESPAKARPPAAGMAAGTLAWVRGGANGRCPAVGGW
jgi:hypothetical protein